MSTTSRLVVPSTSISPDISKEPNEPTPVVVIAEAPLLIAPNPLVIVPAFNAPVVTMLELPATADAPISDKTSLADLPSMLVPFTLRKSSSATPDVNIGMLVSDMPKVSAACPPMSLNTSLAFYLL